jgi:hypothetical protein
MIPNLTRMTSQKMMRLFHRRVAPWLVLPLLFMATTGMIYRVGRSWFGMDKETGSILLDLHSGAWLGGAGSVVFTTLVGSGLILLVTSALAMVWQARHHMGSGPQLWKGHRYVGLVLLLPLMASAVTGILFRIGEEVFDIPYSIAKILMSIHQGSWLGPVLRPYYILLIGLGLFWLIGTGVRMILSTRKKSAV